MSDILNISNCNIAQMIGESNRFLFHVLLVHIATCIINGDIVFFTEDLFKSLLITAMAIIMYHIFFRKIIEPKLEKMNLICFNRDKRNIEKVKIDKKDILKLKSKKRVNELRKKHQKSRGLSKRNKVLHSRKKE
jgi:hypothetical protein